MDAHEKNAVLIAAGLPPKLHGFHHVLLFRLAERNAREFTATGDAIAAATHTSPSTTWRCLAQLEELCLLERTNNGAPPPPDGGRFCHRANSYRLLDVAETAARRSQAEPVIVTVALHCQNDNVVFPGESKIPSAGTGDSTAREAARAKWLPELLGGQEVSLPTNTQPAQCVEILAPSEPVCSEVAPVDPRLGGFSMSGFAASFEVAKRDTGVTSDKMGHRTERDFPAGGTSLGKPESGERGEKMRWNHPVCDPCSQPLRATHVLIRGAPSGRVQFCGWCAQRTESGFTVRCDPAGVPYPDNPADARCYVARFRHTALAGVATIAGPRGPIRLDRMSDAEAVYAAGQFHLIARNVGRIARQRAAAPPPVRRLGLS